MSIKSCKILGLNLTLHFYPSGSSKTLGTKTSIDKERICEEIYTCTAVTLCVLQNY